MIFTSSNFWGCSSYCRGVVKVKIVCKWKFVMTFPHCSSISVSLASLPPPCAWWTLACGQWSVCVCIVIWVCDNCMGWIYLHSWLSRDLQWGAPCDSQLERVPVFLTDIQPVTGWGGTTTGWMTLSSTLTLWFWREYHQGSWGGGGSWKSVTYSCFQLF